MTLFTNIWNADHEFSDGNIEIANTLSSLRKAYIETLVTGLSDSLAYPILLGFLYQIDASAKRSKPYPIVSQRQTINLDLSECETFIFIPSNRLIDDYTLKLYVSTESGDGESVDLTAYALKTELPDFDSFVTQESLVTALSDYALVSQLPDLSSYVSESELETALSNYVSVSQLPDLSSYVTESELATALSSVASFQNFIPSATSTTLESGKSYQSTASDLVFTLPSSPSIADVIKLATGDFSLLTRHGNALQRILNSNTFTVTGSNNGIMLKPYSSISLRFCGFNIWAAFDKTRTVNNFTPITQESTATKKNYTATAPVAAYGALISGIWNGVKSLGALANGYLSDATTGDILVTVSEPILLSQIRLCNGQANVGLGINDPYSVRDIKIYAGSTDTAEYLGVYTFSNTSAAEENKAITQNTAPSNTFLFRVNSVTPRIIGILELELWGKGATGGEVSVS
ncbi:hypothetical protein PseudUWO311_00600 [Pseudanabaena sp. UWO311]|uniref:hypothetical protein n=1 Tax=Pseudanabaena sp. UWO311 TaxID=2487337 RepID=UPI0011597E58|nr:hypothetical protein [Pseudanabaena sp. UWO311]TYQ29430.1 hypothetical protein PseudUWO311_00600 [Pseudanabaena sp. UWO311]